MPASDAADYLLRINKPVNIWIVAVVFATPILMLLHDMSIDVGAYNRHAVELRELGIRAVLHLIPTFRLELLILNIRNCSGPSMYL